MEKGVRRSVVFFLCFLFFLRIFTEQINAENSVEVESPYVVLMEASTGTIIYSKEENERRSPASITKIMTLILIFDALKAGTLHLEDEVITSAHAKSMGGSQVFLEEGEKQNVETMIKCIVIASGNDASVAMAEHISGSESEFVNKMNEKAKELGMQNTNFEDCCGLTESENHYTTAYDVALMSRELINAYPEILNYSSIWMEDIVHETRQGSSNFTLANTNKLLRSYEGCVGLKTGSTSIAKYCLSAVAKRDNMTLISVVMAAPDYKVRFRDAAALLNYGFAKCQFYQDENNEKLPTQKIHGAIQKEVLCTYEGEFSYVDVQGRDLSSIKKKIIFEKDFFAPVKKGERAGVVKYYLEGEEVGEVNLIFAQSVKKAEYQDILLYVLRRLFQRL